LGKLKIPTPLEGMMGNVEFVWDARNDKEVEAAKKVFEEHIEQGYTALRYTSDGNVVIITSFDREAEQIYVWQQISSCC
jgi:hypothetical protein